MRRTSARSRKGDGGWINGGFFVLEPQRPRLHRRRRHALGAGAARAPGPRRPADGLPARRLLAAHGHAARQATTLEALWETGDAPWKAAGAMFGREPSAGRRVLVTGHTGFKGAWLGRWLLDTGRGGHRVCAEPPTRPSLFDALDARRARCATSSPTCATRERAGGRDARPRGRRDRLPPGRAAARAARATPSRVETFETNVMGTVNVLEAVRARATPSGRRRRHQRQVLREPRGGRAFARSDALGGHDPYSASKGCAELVTAAYRRASSPSRDAARRGVRPRRQRHRRRRLGARPHRPRLRARARRRRARSSCATPTPCGRGSTCSSRSPATCCWRRCCCATAERIGGAWNFGPGTRTARERCAGSSRLPRGVGRGRVDHTGAGQAQPHEAHLLSLDSRKARESRVGPGVGRIRGGATHRRVVPHPARGAVASPRPGRRRPPAYVATRPREALCGRRHAGGRRNEGRG